VSQAGEKVVIEELQLKGNPWNYPFDKYETRLSFKINVSDLKIDFPERIYANADVNQFWEIRIVKEESKVTYGKDFSQLDLKVEFTRNLDILPLQLALVGSFFLIGSTFMIANKDLGNRLLITIGVFALIFSFYQLVEPTKPYAFGNATYADVSIALLIFVTIVYMLVSIFVAIVLNKKAFLGNLKKEVWFYIPIIVSMMIVVSLATWNYAYEEAGWVTFATQIGLFAGFLIRVSVLARLTKSDKVMPEDSLKK
jgi:hypothetical protein